MRLPFHPNTLVVGEPGAGKTLAAAADVLGFPGAVVVQDPHEDSLARAVLMAEESEHVLFDRLSDLDHALGYDLLRASRHPNPLVRDQENLRRAQFFVEVLMRRRQGTDLAGSPLTEEWLVALLLLYLNQE